MFYINSECTGVTLKPSKGSIITSVLSNLIDFINSDNNVIAYSKIIGQVIVFNNGFMFNEDLSVYLFDDGNKKILSKLKKIDNNSFLILEDISSLNDSKIIMKIPYVDIKKTTSGNIHTIHFPFDSKLILDITSMLKIGVSRGEKTREWGMTYSNSHYGATYNNNFELFYSDDSMLFVCSNENSSNIALSFIAISSKNNGTEFNTSTSMSDSGNAYIEIIYDMYTGSTGQIASRNSDPSLSIFPRFSGGLFTSFILNSSGNVGDYVSDFSKVINDYDGNIYAVVPVLKKTEKFIVIRI